MNAVTTTKVCEDSLLKKLLDHMSFILQSRIYSEDDERLKVLGDNYNSHLYIKGVFSFDEEALYFKGTIAECKTEIRCTR